MLQASVVITGNKEVIAKLKKLGQEVYQLQSAMQDIGKDVATYASEVGFSSQGGVYGAKWQRLSSKYAARKAKRYPGRSALVATGDMKNSFKSKAGQREVTIYNDDPKFDFHQSTEKRSKMPRRQTLGVNTAVRLIIETRIEKEVNAKLDKVGL